MKLLIISLLLNCSYSNQDTIPTAHIPILQPVSSSEFKYISSEYGWRAHPKTKKSQYHKGIDISTKSADAQIFSTAEGKVTKVGFNKKLGIFIIINHRYQTQTVYGHLSKVYVQENQLIEAGELIGIIGDSGEVTATHLHYEIIHKGVSIDPIKFRERILDEKYKASQKSSATIRGL